MKTGDLLGLYDYQFELKYISPKATMIKHKFEDVHHRMWDDDVINLQSAVYLVTTRYDL